ncbi:MAG: HAMP domain-containing histidine kinase [Alteromonadaceae bacterium]|nr:HAMP domain-containing histidine kinase [Alteromonadaceae bacterium]
MPSQFMTYLLGGIFIVTMTILGTSVSQMLVRQDQVVSFEAPMDEFIQILNRELEYNEYALRSMAQLFRSSESVEKHEFESFAELLLKQYSNITELAYWPQTPNTKGIDEDRSLSALYWKIQSSYTGIDPCTFLPQNNMRSLWEQASESPNAVASTIFRAPEKEDYYAVVLQRVSADEGIVMMVVNVSFSLQRTLGNQVTRGYTLFEDVAGERRLVFSTLDLANPNDHNVISGDYSAPLGFFDRNWLVVSYQNNTYKHQWLYIGIPLTAFVLSILVVYLMAFSAKLRLANKEKEKNLSDLRFAQQKLVEAEKISAMSGVVAGVAHEVNTPLGIGITCMSHLQDCMLDIKNDFEQGKLDATAFEEFIASSEELVGLSMRNMRKAAMLLTNFKKVDVIGNDSEMEPELVVVGDLIDSFIVRYYDKHPDNNIKITTNIDHSIILHTYPSVILDILTYLLSNALVHAFTEAQQDCEISITFPYGNTGTTLMFKDNGIGVEQSLLKRIVDPFFTTRRGSGYAGLGLSVVYNLISSKLNSELTIDVDEGLALSFDIKDLKK